MIEDSIWQPPAPRPPLEKAITEAIRLNLSTLLEAIPLSAGNEGRGRFSVALDLPDPTRLELAVESVDGGRMGKRTVILFNLKGGAAAVAEGWIVKALVAIDRDTRAALRIAADIVSMGAPAS